MLLSSFTNLASSAQRAAPRAATYAVLVLFCLHSLGCDKLTEQQRQDQQQQDVAVPKAANVTGISRIRQTPNGIDGRYIVQLMNSTKGEPIDDVLARLQSRYDIAPDSVYTDVFYGFTVAMNEALAEQVAADPDIRYVEQDQYLATEESGLRLAVPSELQGLPWSLQRLMGQVNAATYMPEYRGSGVNIYVFSSGVDAAAAELKGRVGRGVNVGYANRWLAEVTGDGEQSWWKSLLAKAGGKVSEEDTTDCHGVGTRLATLAAGASLGVAPQANIRPVKIMGCNGRASTSSVLQAVDWLTRRYQRPAIALMPFAGGESKVLDSSIRQMMRKDIMVVAAAGDKAGSACNFSPARVRQAITVAGFNRELRLDLAVNGGQCVDLFMPSVALRTRGLDGSDWITGGSAAAAAYAAGALAQLREEFSAGNKKDVERRFEQRYIDAATNLDSPKILSYRIPVKQR